MRDSLLFMILMYLSEGASIFFLFKMLWESDAVVVVKYGVVALVCAVVTAVFHVLFYVAALHGR
jgi:uncharacterized membrane protein